MKVISIGTDRKLFEEGSGVRLRTIEYGRIFEELHIVVFAKSDLNLERQKISENIFIYPTNSKSRFFYIYDAIEICRSIIDQVKFKLTGRKEMVISTQDPFETGFAGLILKLFYRLPLQVQIHTDFVNKYFVLHSLLNFLRLPMGFLVLSFADSVRVVSLKIEESIKSLTHNVSILPVYSKIEATKNTNKSNDTFKVLTVCRLEREKDLTTAILAFKKLLDRGVDAIFDIVGDGRERSALEDLCTRLGVADKVNFVGWQNNLSDYYSNANVYISTSLYEGYGVSSVEAASFGLPLVLSHTGLAGSMFRDGLEALICKQRDADSFANALFKISTDHDLAEKISKMAKDSVDKNIPSFQDYLARYKSFLQDALNFFNGGHNIFKKNVLLRYLISGITAASTNIGLLYVFTDVFGVHYLVSSVLSFVIAISISFILQKFWTFNDKKIDGVHYQFLGYMVVAILGIFINTFSMFVMVDWFDIWYILAQIFTGALIAVFNFFMYKFFVFKK